MKQIFLSAAIAVLSVSAFAQSAIKPIAIGAPIPATAVKMQGTDGKTYTLNGLKSEKGLLVMFSCNTCPYVVKSQQRTMDVMKLAQSMNIPMVVINSNAAQRGEQDSYDAMKKYGQEQGYFAPYVLDEKSEVANAFGASRTPEVFLFNAKGKLAYSGAMEDNPSEPASSKELYLASALKNLNTATPISPATTKSIGCSIKRAN